VLEATWPILVAEPVGVDEATDAELVLLDLVVDEAADTELVLLDIVIDAALVPDDELAGFALHLIPVIKNIFFRINHDAYCELFSHPATETLFVELFFPSVPPTAPPITPVIISSTKASVKKNTVLVMPRIFRGGSSGEVEFGSGSFGGGSGLEGA
jgi:hypothetical protein